MTEQLSSTAAGPYAPFGLSRRGDDVGLERLRMHTALGEMTVHAGRREPGDDTALVLLHGAAGSWSTFSPLLKAADTTGGRLLHNIVAPDLPGWGSTPLPEDDADFTIAALADAVIELTTALGYRRWRIVGHSLGGALALHIAARRPAETVATVLVSPSAFGVAEAGASAAAGIRILPAFVGMRAAMGLLGLHEPTGRVVARALGRAGLLRLLAAPLFAHSPDVDESVFRALGEEIRPIAFTRAVRAAAASDPARDWAGITTPVTVLVGDRDVFVAGSDPRRLGSVIPRLRTVELADSGHFANVERPFALLEAIASA